MFCINFVKRVPWFSSKIPKSSIRHIYGNSRKFPMNTAYQELIISPKIFMHANRDERTFRIYHAKEIYPTTTTKACNYSTASKSTLDHRTKIKNCEAASKKMSTFEGFQEFFSHPMTWQKNYGYLNILLGLIIFAFFFCSSCPPPSRGSNVSHDIQKEK
ncbi:uncharacterized protein LOC142239139 [Haematobia irritans]|uniref:uncharacterized protein LOC142239139 n=1 Tax=Haematobia irritans TaxID=7368 RepID=UPI003F4F7B40